MKKLALAAALALSAGPVSAQSYGPPAEPRFTVEETRQSFFTLQEAVRAIGAGRGTIRIAPGRYEECAVQEEGQIAYVAAQAGRVIFDSVPCEQKAALVLRGRSAEVRGIVFQNLQVPDGNGAGIRIEQGDLLVRESLFRDSQSGILSADDADGRIRIERSTFSGLGRCDGELACAHSIYVNGYGALSIANSRFERGAGGHYVKTRAPRIEVVDSSFDDSAGRATNYMIDLSNGASGLIAGNMFVQGANKENHGALIVVGAEGQDHDSSGLVVRANQAELAPEARRTSFVADLTGARFQIVGNRLTGQITELERRR